MQKLSGNIDIVNNPIELDLWKKLLDYLSPDEDSIIGYKIPKLGSENKNMPTFFIRSKKIGIIIIEVVTQRITNFEEEFWQTSAESNIFSRDIILQDFVNEIQNRFSKNKELYNRKERKISIPVISILIFAENESKDIDHNLLITENVYSKENLNTLKKIFSDTENKIDNNQFTILNSILDGTNPFNKRERKKTVIEYKTINDFIQKSLEETFHLDKIQRSIAMQIPNGPQRIRGLAGTGKTVILCMKAALAHKENKDFKILFLFNTQSMYNQIIKYITDYYLNEAKTNPDWGKLDVFHAWGGKQKKGLYSHLCETYGITPKTFFDAKHSKDALDYIYNDLIAIKNKLEPVYDMVLIDEAQDFSPQIFETIYYITKKPKRIIWAYDEFQSLKELTVKEPEELFGLKEDGSPNMNANELEGTYSGDIEKDYVLPNSYRNPRLNLMVAHGIGLGLYSQNACIPMKFQKDWTSRGYQIIEPDKPVFETGNSVIVRRPETNSKNILENLLKSQDKDEKVLVKYNHKTTINEELIYVVNSIERLINKQGVEPEEIIVITLDTKNSKEHLLYIRFGLVQKNIASCSPGYVETPDSFKEKGRVTLTTTYKAKGNEANVVFVINAQHAIDDKTYNARNALFVSITRSRGWCFISGNGQSSIILEKEYKDILNDYPEFKFIFPDEEAIKRRLKIINSDKTELEKADKDINYILQDETLKALLIEKISQNEELKKEFRIS